MVVIVVFDADYEYLIVVTSFWAFARALILTHANIPANLKAGSL